MGKGCMQRGSRTAVCVLYVCIFLCSFVLAGAHDGGAPKIRVGYFLLDGFQETSGEGFKSGYGYDYLMEIAQYTGWEYEFVDGSWEECLSMLESGQIDILGAVQRSEEREEIFDFTQSAVGSGNAVLFTSQDSSLSYEDFESFDGIVVGLIEGSSRNSRFDEYAQRNGFEVKKRYFATTEELIRALEDGKIGAALLNSLYRLKNMRVIARFSPDPFYFATTKGNETVLQGLNHAIEQIALSNPNYASELYNHYFGPTVGSSPVFTNDELKYISEKQTVTGIYNPARQPIEYSENNEYKGITADIFKLIAKQSGLTFSFLPFSRNWEGLEDWQVSPRAEIQTAVSHDYQWAEQHNIILTKAYLSIPIVKVISSSNYKPDQEVVAMPEGYYITKQVEKSNPQIQVRYYSTFEDCFKALLTGKANATYTNTYTASLYLNNVRYTSLLFSDAANLTVDLAVGVSKDADPRLLSILNKSLASISEDEINDIIISHTSHVEKGDLIDFFYSHPIESIIGATAIFLLVLCLLIYLYILRSRHAHKMEEMLYNDSLTGLYNQVGFEKRAGELIRDNKDKAFVVVDFDINAFETLNAYFGYDTGDQILMRIATALQDECGMDEVCGRISADRFVCLWVSQGVETVTARIYRFNEEVRLLSNDTSILLSYGFYEVTDRTQLVSSMVDKALTAKRRIKGKHDRFVEQYDERLHRQMLAENEMVTHMTSALENGEFIPFYQPKYDIQTETVVGAEALVRWRRMDGTFVSPIRFISLFEKNGLIVQLDLYMLKRTCCLLRSLLDDGQTPVPVSVNFSRVHLYDKEFVEKLTEIVASYHIPPQLIQIEVTESSVSESTVDIDSIFASLHRAGFSIAVDDFGSGESSLGMLKDLPVDVVKLDRSFLDDNCKTDNGRYILEGILYAMNKMNVVTLAEGVETAEQLNFLMQCGCDEVQGYYFAKPMGEDDFVRLLKEGKDHTICGAKSTCLFRKSPYGLIETQNLLNAVTQLYPLVISVNLTQNSYFIMEHQGFCSVKAPENGEYDQLLSLGGSVVHPDDQDAFVYNLSRENLLELYKNGNRVLTFRSRQKGEEEERWFHVITHVLFIDNPNQGDVLEITMSRVNDEA